MRRLATICIASIGWAGFPLSSVAAVITFDPVVAGSVRVFAPPNEAFCGTDGAFKDFDDVQLLAPAQDSSVSSRCSMAFLEWDTTLIPDGSTISRTELMFTVDTMSDPGEACSFVDMGDVLRAHSPAHSLANALLSNGAYINSFGPCRSMGDKAVLLGSRANSDLRNLLPQDRFLVGLRYTDNHERPRSGDFHTVLSNASLRVIFSPPPPPPDPRIPPTPPSPSRRPSSCSAPPSSLSGSAESKSSRSQKRSLRAQRIADDATEPFPRQTCAALHPKRANARHRQSKTRRGGTPSRIMCRRLWTSTNTPPRSCSRLVA